MFRNSKELYLKPYLNNAILSEKHKIANITYNSALNSDVECQTICAFSKAASCQTDNSSNNQSELKKRLGGRILLQVEAHGEAYYVYPKDSKRYYMANGDEAYRIMRYLGVGITNKDLDRVMADKIFAKKHSGKIFLQVEANGEAYYIDIDGYYHYLKNGEAAYNIMRDLGLGITNNDLNKILEGCL